jgi:hypothetical protein
MSKSTRFTLFRVNPEGTQEEVGKHPSFEDGWSAGQAAVAEDRESAFSLYRGSRRVARFGHSRLMPRRSADTLDWSVLG